MACRLVPEDGAARLPFSRAGGQQRDEMVHPQSDRSCSRAHAGRGVSRGQGLTPLERRLWQRGGAREVVSVGGPKWQWCCMCCQHL